MGGILWLLLLCTVLSGSVLGRQPEGENVAGRVRVSKPLLHHDGGGGRVYYDGEMLMLNNRTLVAEGLWKSETQQICMVACPAEVQSGQDQNLRFQFEVIAIGDHVTIGVESFMRPHTINTEPLLAPLKINPLKLAAQLRISEGHQYHRQEAPTVVYAAEGLFSAPVYYPHNSYYYPYADVDADFFTRDNKIVIPLLAIVLMSVVYIQQKWNGWLVLSRPRSYSRLPVKNTETELVS
ncbi:unnamed protein product [Sphagnum troendelagicum]|uniref:DUF2921 domain-containing protein n=1 Tax=Sphagnum troendelagicum TaxID=128251 RepID=A0ABP0U655_9BRYO